MIETHLDAIDAVRKAYSLMLAECQKVLGSELHYQAMIYHCLRISGVPSSQVGMNVKMLISNPVTPHFQTLDKRKNARYQGGFEPIPDIVIFSPRINGDWRRRNRINTLQETLVAIEVKASERHKGRLTESEIVNDLKKLIAHRNEALHRNAGFAPVMIIVDTAPDPVERMKQFAIDRCKEYSTKENVGLIYIGADTHFSMLDDILWDSPVSL